jgi:GNAT superfamily N-acetyltransferase
VRRNAEEPLIGVHVVPLDASDPQAMAEWYATYHAGDVFGREHSTPFSIEELRPLFLADNLGERVLAFSGYVDGVVVTSAKVDLPLRDNLHLAYVEVFSHPEHRCRGHGSAMLDHVTTLAREHGRRTLCSVASTPYVGAVDGRGHPNADFLLHRGFTHALGDIMRLLDLPADGPLLRRLADQSAPHHDGYTIRQFKGPVPDDIVEQFGRLIGAVQTEAPTGDLELEPEQFDTERIRADELLFAASGRTKYTTVAVAADGTAAAYSEIMVPEHDPGRAYQWGTLVLQEHRGHRLGMATKAHNLLWVQAERADLRELVTHNAEVNRHMVGVNDEMGFRPVERLGEYQRLLG